jgi:hypothetical protein
MNLQNEVHKASQDRQKLSDREKSKVDELIRDLFGYSDDEMLAGITLRSTLAIATSFSPLAREDLAKILTAGGQVAPWGSVRRWVRAPENEFIDQKFYVESYLWGHWNSRIDTILTNVLSEMSQLASRLLVKNKELYGRYDRFRSEASFRINVSIALLALLGTATYLTHFHWPVKVALILVEVAVAMLLFRQGILRSISARDVIAQAIAIAEVESAYIKPRKTGASGSGGAAVKQDESSDDETGAHSKTTNL